MNLDKKGANPINPLSLGIIGLSQGNGHPYSWSAIFNGYNEKYMKDCPFPVIPKYLSKQNFPRDAITKAEVTHIWTQDRDISLHIAKAANIKNVVDNYTDLIGKVDAILLARDDYDLHYEMSIPFIEAELPIYIDKPIAVNLYEAKKIFSKEQYEGQIFTCSAIQYAKEFILADKEKESIGNLNYVDACIKGPWDRYSIHIIEPVLKIIGAQGGIVETQKTNSRKNVVLTVLWESGLITTFSVFLDTESPCVIRLFGENGYKQKMFNDTFYAFKSALQDFVDISLERKKNNIKNFSLKAVSIVEKGI